MHILLQFYLDLFFLNLQLFLFRPVNVHVIGYDMDFFIIMEIKKFTFSQMVDWLCNN